MRSLPPVLLLSSCAVLVSCASPSAGRPAILSSSMGPALEALWDASGGLEAWRGIGSVRFTYQAEVEPAALSAGIPLKALAAQDGGAHRAGRIGPCELAFEVGDWRLLEVGSPGNRRDILLEEPHRPDLADYAFRSARVLALFPFALADPVWEFRRDLIAGELPDPFSFRVLPAGAATPHRGYLVDLDPGSGLLRAVWYEVEHPCFHGKIFKAVFGGYRTVQGLRVATEITHLLCDASMEPAGRYPWEAEKPETPHEAASEGWIVLREKITSLEFTERPRALARDGGGSR